MAKVQHSSTRAFPSKVCDGVTIHIKKTSEKRRAELMRSLAPYIDRERELQKQLAAVMERQVVKKKPESAEEEIDPETCEPVKEFKNEEDILDATRIVQELQDFRTLQVYPFWLRWGLTKLEDLEIDEHPATVEDLINGDAPDGLFEEVLYAIQERTEVSGEKKSEP